MSLILNSGFTIGPGVELNSNHPPIPVSAGLRLHLDAGNPASFTYPSSTWTDLVDGKVFTLYNNPSSYSSFGGYINFIPSAGQYAEATSFPDSLSHWTVEAWHYYDGTHNNNGLGNSPCIVTEVYAGSGTINYTLGNCSDSYPSLQVGHWDGAHWYPTPQGYSLTVNHWHHIVGTFDGTAHRLYVDGQPINATATTSPAIQSGAGIRLMRRWDNPEYWGGALAVVRIYETALDAAGVLQNFQAERTRFEL